MQRLNRQRGELTSFAEIDWSSEAKLILKAHLKRAGFTYKTLASRFEQFGIHETEANIRNKLSRGSFTAAYFLQCLALIGNTTIDVRYFFKEDLERQEKLINLLGKSES